MKRIEERRGGLECGVAKAVVGILFHIKINKVLELREHSLNRSHASFFHLRLSGGMSWPMPGLWPGFVGRNASVSIFLFRNISLPRA